MKSPRKQDFLCAARGRGLVPMDSERWDRFLADHDGALIYATLEANPKKHSSRQRAYYRGVVVPHVAEILESILKEPITNDDAHEWLKHRFIGPRKTRLGEIPPTTTTLSVEAMTAYIDKIIEFFREHYGSVIPAANEIHEAA